ncbi:MAG: hypothetical protein HWQ40_26820 [Nostoc sp. NMS9]|nr:hypothetical protein [Nostoc sp. NMS9]
MRVGILGSGLMGGKFGTLFARAGHEVVFSYARRHFEPSSNHFFYAFPCFPLPLHCATIDKH